LQRVEVKPSYGLDDETVEQMLLDALDHGETDFDLRRLVEARVEAERILLATDKAWQSDVRLLSTEERPIVERAMTQLRAAVERSREATSETLGAAASELQLLIDGLASVTHEWAGRRMNDAITRALAGKDVTNVAASVAGAKGVDAHLAEHARDSH
jgi:molecular chaperone HscA